MIHVHLASLSVVLYNNNGSKQLFPAVHGLTQGCICNLLFIVGEMSLCCGLNTDLWTNVH